MSYDYPHPVSRTYQYKKITKPLLERKRRARINRCLDELKDLMVDALETEGENISKLEKADILELTVRHLQRLQASRSAGLVGISTATTTTTTTTVTATTTTGTTTITNDDVTAESRWQSGFGHCAAEACRFLAALPGEAAENLARHLAAGLQSNTKTSSLNIKPNLSPTLIDLDRSNLVVSCPISPLPTPDANAIVPNVQIPANNRTSPYPDIEKARKFINASPIMETTTVPLGDCTEFVENDRTKSNSTKGSQRDSVIKGKGNNPQRINADDEEEIDVERVDDGDPMWRPW
ncbi:hypothetical protein KPH14_004623 [Odynerus spinipes]|uniref:BHLH domain-containing protein n=1 Tax=Odynerus spinipes TaxID=1348599 RepID=A0AAD9RML4_9HYME|nr:hypothetical protein KPH14_004623 [Odynerus spinipes]